MLLQACAQRPPMDSDVLPQSRVPEKQMPCSRASLQMMFASSMLCPTQACEDPPDGPTPVRQARIVPDVSFPCEKNTARTWLLS